jgi:uncharacterized glyoxalase superfamily metalloenzyme YdcJ
MTVQPFVSPDLIRQRFSKAMSDMYREEVPLYGADGIGGTDQP